MNRNELKQIAKGLKKARPEVSQQQIYIEVMGQPSPFQIWNACVTSVAASLELKDHALSNFYAAAGYIHVQASAPTAD